MQRALTYSFQRSLLKNLNAGRPLSHDVAVQRQVDYDDLPPMPSCPIKPEPYKGMSYESMKKVRQSNLSAGLVTFYRKPLLIHQGYQQWLFDHEGQRYLDMFAGIVTVSVGHCHPKPLEALQKQAERLWHTTSIYMYPGIQEYAEKLASKLPDPLNVWR